MNIAAHGPIIAFVLNHVGAVPPLEQVARSPPTPPRPDRIAGEKPLHSRAEVRPRRLHDQMEMISHNDVTQQFPPMADDSLLEPVNESTAVRIITHDFLAGIASRHHVINRALEFNPQSSWHFPRLGVGTAVVKLKTKNQG